MSMHDGPGTDRDSDGGLSDMDGGNNDTPSEDHGRGNDYGGEFSSNISDQNDYGDEQSFDGLGSWSNDTTSEDQGRFNDYDGAFSSSTLGRGIERISYVNGVLYDSTTVGIIADDILEDAINKFGLDQINAGVETFNLSLAQLQDYGTTTFREGLGIIATMSSGNMLGALNQITKNFSNNLTDVHIASELDRLGSIGSKVGTAVGALLGITAGPLMSIAGYTIGGMFAEYALAEDMKRAGLEPVGPRESEETTLNGMLDSVSDGGNQDDFDGSVSVGSASDQEAGFTLSPSYSGNAEKILSNLYLLPVFNSTSSMNMKAIASNFVSVDNSMTIKGFDYDGLLGVDSFDSLVDAGGMFLFVQAFNSKGKLF